MKENSALIYAVGGSGEMGAWPAGHSSSSLLLFFIATPRERRGDWGERDRD